MRGIYFPLIFLLVLAEIFTAWKKLSGGRSSSQNNTSHHQQNKNTMVSAFHNISQLLHFNILKIVTNLDKNKTPPAFVRLTGFANETSEIGQYKSYWPPKGG